MNNRRNHNGYVKSKKHKVTKYKRRKVLAQNGESLS